MTADTPRRDGRPVMVDVARLAGVSQKTVSRVVNGESNVSPKVRDSVQKVIAELGFVPNAAARALVTQRAGTIGIVTPATTLHGPSSQLLGLERAAWEAGYSVMIVSVQDGTQSEVAAAIDRLLVGGVAGLILNGSVLSDDVTALDLRRTPAVAIGDPAPGALGIPSVVTDQRLGVIEVVSHLLGLGHRTVHLLSGQLEWRAAASRASAWREALAAAGAPIPTAVEGDWTARSGYEVGMRLARDEAVTAIFCANDQMAIGVTRALLECGREVPQDVSVVGFDDAPEAAYLPTPLTTVRQDFVTTTRLAIEQLIRLLDGQEVPDLVATIPELVVRASTAPPRLRRP